MAEEIQNQRIQLVIPDASAPANFTRITHNSIIQYVNEIQRRNRSSEMEEFRTKLEVIDRAYYSFNAEQQSEAEAVKKALRQAGAQFEIPIVLSQVDTMTAFLMEVFLDTYPLFPVVAPVGQEAVASQLEALIDDQAIRGRWARHILLFLRNCAKYNFGPIEVDWSAIGRLMIQTDNTTVNAKPRLIREDEKINRIIAPDPYNTLWDFSVDPSDVAESGDYGGYNSVMSRTQLKRLIATLQNSEENVFNIKEAFESAEAVSEQWDFYFEKPEVSKYVKAIDKTADPIDWVKWATADNTTGKDAIDYKNSYFVTKLYARIIPKDHGLIAPNPKTPQIWKFLVINNSIIIHMKKLISPLDLIPILIGQPQEDGFSTQTRSLGEQSLPMQDIGSELINIRLNGSRRSLNDRAIYDPNVLDSADVNSIVPSAKIPTKRSLRGIDVRQHYLPIPFDDRGTAGALTDVNTLIQLSEFLGAINSARQGQFRKGNRTLGEFNEIQTNSELRSRMVAVLLEYQIFIPMKEIIKANIFQNLTRKELLTQSQESVQVDPDELRQVLLDFKVADGHTSRALIANVDALSQMFQIAVSIPGLAQEYNINGMFAHVMSTLGVRNIQKFRTPQNAGAPNEPPIQ